MASYAVPVLEMPTRVARVEILLVASGVLRQSASEICRATRAAMMAERGIHVRLCGD
jgi:hypothetical protein